ncbi:MAG: Crp/Fnr family transcriptional regulator [Tannerella sp.]|jgi:CRP-like cAMP-binding protein|nr:Crp/Fnr family transcriptional regulator [Tannerella sp.]
MKSVSEVAGYIANKYDTSLQPEELQQFASIMEFRELRKGEVFLDQGQIAKDIIYVYSGTLRLFYYKKGRDVTEHFAGADTHFVYSITSLFRKQQTELMIEALEQSMIYTMNYDRLRWLLLQIPQLAKLYIDILEESLIISQKKADSWRFETVKERYERFFREYPEVVKIASVNHIASYLLMTPESLSRIRAGSL